MLGRVLFLVGALAAGLPLQPRPVDGQTGRPLPTAGQFERMDESKRAEHVLNRLTFGARPGDLAAVKRMGVDQWLEMQLHPERIPDSAAEARVAGLETQRRSVLELAASFPRAEEFLALIDFLQALTNSDVYPSQEAATMSAEQARSLTATTVRQLPSGQIVFLSPAVTYAYAHGRSHADEVMVAKTVRAAAGERQLLEMMIDFWENHFSVTTAKAPTPFSVAEYSRDAIRPHAFGKFRDLLGAVAKSPTMLFSLDNWLSSADSTGPRPLGARFDVAASTALEARFDSIRASALGTDTLFRRKPRTIARGVNENYARELLELHTMGAGGGYTQKDVIEVARALTGWSIDHPELGGGFLFRPDWHDAGAKEILGTTFPAGRGLEDGEQLLDLISKHPSTARFIARKLVVRFVADSAPPALVDRAAATFLSTGGDIREVMRVIVFSPEFNANAAYRAKVRTPFEYVTSVYRILGAAPDISMTGARWVASLGQPVYGYATPEGWPDYAAAWMNAGALNNRMRFASEVTTGRVAPLSFWTVPLVARLEAGSANDAPALVIDEILLGSAGDQTRSSLTALDPLEKVKALETDSARFAREGVTFTNMPSAAATGRRAYISALMAVAFAAPEFQRR